MQFTMGIEGPTQPHKGSLEIAWRRPRQKNKYKPAITPRRKARKTRTETDLRWPDENVTEWN